MASASISRTPEGKYRVRWREPGGTARSKTFAKNSDAQRYRNKILNDLDTGTYVRPNTVRVGDLADQWKAHQRARLAHGTIETNKGNYNSQVSPVFAQRPLVDITSSEIQDWVSHVATTMSGSTARNSYQVLRGILDIAVQSRLIPTNPAYGVKLPAQRRKKMVPLPVHQVHSLAKATPAPVYEILIYILAFAGLRYGEALALRVEDFREHSLVVNKTVSYRKGRMVNAPKTDTSRRTVEVPQFVAGEVIQWIKKKKLEPSDLLLPSERTGGYMSKAHSSYGWFFKAKEQAKVPVSFVPHDLRHTCASLMIAHGATPLEVARQLGHSKPSITLDIYGELFDYRSKDIMAQLNTVIMSNTVPKN